MIWNPAIEDIDKFNFLLIRLESLISRMEKVSTHPQICMVCGEWTDFWASAPYGSEHDGDEICGECIDKLWEEE